MHALVTGACGFVAQHLCPRLARDGYTVTGVDQWPTCSVAGIEYRQVNLLEAAAVNAVMALARPSRVFHLAGISYLPDADVTPRVALETNIIGTVSLLDAVRNASADARILLVGSAKEYGANIAGDSLHETTPANPTDFYGISKFAAEQIGMQYVRQLGLDVRFTRSFNHTGPGQSPRFVCSEWARKVAEIELGKSLPRMEVGDTSHDIDFTDVRDVVAAYCGILEKGRRGEIYNVCSGKTASLGHVLGYLCGKSARKIRVATSSAKQRSHKASPHLAGDNAKLRTHTGWSPSIPLEKTLDDLFDYWMRALKNPSA